MATEVLMPKLGLTMTEGTIEEWKIKEGQPVKNGDVLTVTVSAGLVTTTTTTTKATVPKPDTNTGSSSETTPAPAVVPAE